MEKNGKTQGKENQQNVKEETSSVTPQQRAISKLKALQSTSGNTPTKQRKRLKDHL